MSLTTDSGQSGQSTRDQTNTRYIITKANFSLDYHQATELVKHLKILHAIALIFIDADSRSGTINIHPCDLATLQSLYMRLDIQRMGYKTQSNASGLHDLAICDNNLMSDADTEPMVDTRSRHTPCYRQARIIAYIYNTYMY